MFFLRSVFVLIHSPGDIIGLLDCNSDLSILSSIVTVLVLICESFVFLTLQNKLHILSLDLSASLINTKSFDAGCCTY